MISQKAILQNEMALVIFLNEVMTLRVLITGLSPQTTSQFALGLLSWLTAKQSTHHQRLTREWQGTLLAMD